MIATIVSHLECKHKCLVEKNVAIPTIFPNRKVVTSWPKEVYSTRLVQRVRGELIDSYGVCQYLWGLSMLMGSVNTYGAYKCLWGLSIVWLLWGLSILMGSVSAYGACQCLWGLSMLMGSVSAYGVCQCFGLPPCGQEVSIVKSFNCNRNYLSLLIWLVVLIFPYFYLVESFKSLSSGMKTAEKKLASAPSGGLRRKQRIYSFSPTKLSTK